MQTFSSLNDFKVHLEPFGACEKLAGERREQFETAFQSGSQTAKLP